ncbi:MAG: AEC family transporter [Clostridia bacterium]|nr:AEC family transporter [Clostridia bacterium]
MVFSQVFALLFFVSLGFALAKSKLINASHADTLSKIIVCVFLPANIFKTFALNFNRDYIFKNYTIIIFAALSLLVINFIAFLAAKLFSKVKYERDVYEYSIAIPNSGYMGYPLVEGIGGQAMLLDFMTYAIPNSLYIYLVAFAKLTKRGFSVKKLLNPPTVTIAIGMFFGILEIPVPDVFANIVKTASGCMGPMAMLMTGIVLSDFNLKKMALKWKIYPALLLRLIVIPLGLGGVLSLFASDTIVKISVLFYCMPCGLNTVVFPKLVGEDCETGAALSIFSTVASLATIPMICAIFGI